MVSAYFLIPTIESFHAHLSVIAPNNANIFQQKWANMAYPIKYDNRM